MTEADIVKEVVGIAFSDESKPSDKLRALDWLGEHLSSKKRNEEVMQKLTDVLSRIESGF